MPRASGKGRRTAAAEPGSAEREARSPAPAARDASQAEPAADRATSADAAPAAGEPGTVAVRDGIAWITFDEPGKKVNTLSRELREWFAARVEELAREPLAGLVLRSAKPDVFVAGADIEELQTLRDKAAVRDLLRRGHELCRRFEALPFPTVAAIHGACLGGGLELALCCDWRVATEHEKTKLGLPEVQLGLFPGLGGTQRLPRLIGVPEALDLILTGRQVSASRARRLGLVDETCHPADLGRAALRILGSGKRRPARRPPRSLAGKVTDLLARSPLGHALVFERARAETLKKTGGHYPAPLRAIEVVERGLRLPLPQALRVEAEAFAELVVGETAKSLISIFFMKNRVEAKAASLAREARPVVRVGVLGAGLMGAGIAQGLAERGVAWCSRTATSPRSAAACPTPPSASANASRAGA